MEGAVQESIFRDLRIQFWEKAFEDGEMVAIPVAQRGPLGDCVLVDPRQLAEDGDGVIINAILPKCWVPIPTVIVPGKPFAVKIKLDKGTGTNEDNQPIPQHTLTFQLHYLTDVQLARVQEILRASTPVPVDENGQLLNPEPKEVH